MKTKKQSFVWLIAAGMLLIAMLPIFWIGKYDRPTADDYDYSIDTHEEIQENGVSFTGLVRAAWVSDMGKYVSWQGLYTSAFVLALQPGIFGQEYYCLTPIIVCLSVFLPFWGAAHILQKRLLGEKKVPDTLLALLLTFIVAQQMPYPNQGIFWFNGAMNYTPYCIFDFFVLALMLEAYCGSRKEQIAAVTAATVLSFLISGGNHVTSFLNILMLGLVTLLFLAKKKFWSLTPLAAACIGFVIMYMAPGTGARESNYEKQNIIVAGILSLFQGVKSISTWITLGFLCTMLLLTPLAWEIAKKNTLRLKFRWPLLTLAASYCLISAMWFAPKYAMGNFGAGRLENVVWITFLLLAFLNYAYLLGWARLHIHIDTVRKGKWLPRRAMLSLAGIFCILGILGTPNGGNCEYGTSIEALVEIAIGNASAYAQECDVRFAAFSDPAQSEVSVKAIQTKATLLYISDLQQSPDVWPNTSMERYFGKDAISLTE